MLSLTTPYDVQLDLKEFIKTSRKNQKLTVEALAIKSGVPNSTIRKFESTGNISLRQFLMIYDAVCQLDDLQKLTRVVSTPKSIQEVLNNA
jgi:transcriptional regulator with XRE-family HTH domain